MVRSLWYEYILNIIALLQFVEIAFRETFYSINKDQITVWFIFQATVNSIFMVTLILDWAFLGLMRSF